MIESAGAGGEGLWGCIFLAHPRSVGESYAQHLAAALGFAARLAAAAGACFVHAWLPLLFQRTASRSVGELHARMAANRRRLFALGAELDYAI